MKWTIFLPLVLLLASCSVDKRYAPVCSALRSVQPDAQGYLPRDAVFQAAGISETGLLPYFKGLGRGSAPLKGGGWLEFTELDPHAKAAPRELGTIDEVLNNPNRLKSAPIAQLESVVVRDDKMREVCRVDAPAIR